MRQNDRLKDRLPKFMQLIMCCGSHAGLSQSSFLSLHGQRRGGLDNCNLEGWDGLTETNINTIVINESCKYGFKHKCTFYS